MAARIKKSNETEHQIDKPYNSLQKRFAKNYQARTDYGQQRTAKDHKKPLSPDYPIKIYIERDALSKYRDKWEMLLANA